MASESKTLQNYKDKFIQTREGDAPTALFFIKDDGTLTTGLDGTTRALTTIGYEHHEVHSGSHYFVKEVTDLTGSASRQYVLVVADTTAWPHLLHEIEFEKESTVTITEGISTDTDGTEITPVNSDRNSANTAGMKVYHTPTNPSGGTVIGQCTKGDKQKAGGLIRGPNEIILKQNTKYLIDITNETASNSQTCVFFDWYEHTDVTA